MRSREAALSSAPARIARFVEITDRDRAQSDIDAIFFEASGTQRFESDAARAAFRERWLGRYVTNYPDETFVALAENGTVVGYLVGALDDPARCALFADIPYFVDFSPLTARFPAHLHINLTAACRSRGIGACLIEAFAAHAARASVPGMHAVTAEGVRNNRFYLACGFQQLAATDWNGKRIAFFGRPLISPK